MKYENYPTSFISVLFLVLTGCATPATTTTQKVAITPDEAKAIVTKHVEEQQYYQNYYKIGSPQYDSRVESLTVGTPILVTDLSTTDGAYYIVTGVLPDGQMLAAEAIDAYTGAFIEGKVWTEDVETRFVTSAEATTVAKSVVSNALSSDLKPVFVYDPSSFSVSKLLSWKYAVSNSTSVRTLSPGAVLVDPFVKNFHVNNTVLATNAGMSSIGFNHRLFKYSAVNDNKGPTSTNDRSVTGTGVSLVPLD